MHLTIDINLHVHGAETDKRLEEIILLLQVLRKQESKIMADLTALTAAVQRETDVEQSAVVLLQQLKSQLDAAGTDPVALKALSDQLGSNADALAAAVVANTPAAP
jgi:hypothetical protein